MINETFKNNLNSIGVELTDRQYEQFDMYYIDQNGDKKRPYIIHRTSVSYTHLTLPTT